MNKSVFVKEVVKVNLMAFIKNLLNSPKGVKTNPPLGRWKLKDNPFIEKPGQNYPW